MPESSWIWIREHCVPSNYEAARAIRDELISELENHDWGKREIFGVHLALEEALANAIKHGNQEDEAKRIHAILRLSEDRVQIVIADEGEGFDYYHLPDPTDKQHREKPSGRGVLLMEKFMDRVEFNERGNRVLLEKRRLFAD